MFVILICNRTKSVFSLNVKSSFDLPWYYDHNEKAHGPKASLCRFRTKETINLVALL